MSKNLPNSTPQEQDVNNERVRGEAIQKTREELNKLKGMIVAKTPQEKTGKLEENVLYPVISELLKIMELSNGKISPEIFDAFRESLTPEERNILIKNMTDLSGNDELDKELVSLSQELDKDYPEKTGIADRLYVMINDGLERSIGSESGQGLIESVKKKFDIDVAKDDITAIKHVIQAYIVDVIANLLISFNATKIAAQLRWKLAKEEATSAEKKGMETYGDKVESQWIEMCMAWMQQKTEYQTKNPKGPSFNTPLPTIAEALKKLEEGKQEQKTVKEKTPVEQNVLRTVEKNTDTKVSGTSVDNLTIRYNDDKSIDVKYKNETYILTPKNTAIEIGEIAILARKDAETSDTLRWSLTQATGKTDIDVRVTAMEKALDENPKKDLSISNQEFTFTKKTTS